MTINNVREILDDSGDLPDSVLLGRLVLFTISVGDSSISRAALEQQFVDNNLRTDTLPPEINPADAFRKATSEAKAEYTRDDGTTCQVLARDVATTREYIKRQITREVKDSKARRLSYARAISCTFYRPQQITENGKLTIRKGSERVSIQVDPTELDPAELPEMRRIAREIGARYQRHSHYLDSNRIRHTVREYLKALNAIEIKGGVYFVHISQADELRRLEGVISQLGASMMHTIPLVDIKREREMITAAFEREAAQNLQDLSKEVKDLLTTRKKVTPAAYSKMKAKFEDTVNKAQEHMSNLQISQDITGAAAEIALNSLLELQKAVSPDDD